MNRLLRKTGTNQTINKKGAEIMKKILVLAAAVAMVGLLAGCGSLRTPTSGARAKNVYYNTFFGVSIESAVYGDGLIVNQK